LAGVVNVPAYIFELSFIDNTSDKFNCVFCNNVLELLYTSAKTIIVALLFNASNESV
jgi:hypothetical protein